MYVTVVRVMKFLQKIMPFTGRRVFSLFGFQHFHTASTLRKFVVLYGYDLFYLSAIDFQCRILVNKIMEMQNYCITLGGKRRLLEISS